MNDFQIATKINSSPQGKRKIYFTCHPEDFSATFKEIKNEILDREDAAIFYLETYVDHNKVSNYLSRLREMKLLVVPVTKKLLTTPNRAMDVDVWFAQKNNIPILPLMVESGLDKLYQKGFGSLQYLDRLNSDPTADSYEKRLSEFFKFVFYKPKVESRIRDSFDAYIFISYRKKDRQYAQELMKLIHEYDFARDIGIWYDEFLTPGEDFNDEIREALEKCDLVAMSLTPNMLEKPGGRPNFVMDKEYPCARELCKPILPVELAATDRKKLANAYRDIPEVIAKDDHKALGERLLQLLRQIGFTKKTRNPEHNYYIGLAYLSGFDVEVNHERAVELITGAAQAGFPDAVKKLITMYDIGEGVKRDQQKAVEWREKLVEVFKEQYDTEQDKDTGLALLDAMSGCAGAYLDAGQPEKAKEIYLERLQYCDSISDAFFPGMKRYHTISYNALGRIAMDQGKAEEAEAYLSKSAAISEQLAEGNFMYSHRDDLAIEYSNLGELALSNDKYDEAQKWYLKAVEMNDWLSEERRLAPYARTKMIFLRRYSHCYSGLGDAAKKRGKLDEAKKWYQKGLACCEELIRPSGEIMDRQYAAIVYDKLGDLAKGSGSIDEAEKWYRKGFALKEALVKETGTIIDRNNYATGCEYAGDVEVMKGNLSEADEWYRKSSAVLEELISEVGSVQRYRRNLAIIYQKSGDLAKQDGRLAEAEERYRKCLALREALAEETGTTGDRNNLAVIYGRFGDVAKTNGRLDEAEEWFRKDRCLTEKLADETGALLYRRNLAIIYEESGDLAKQDGRLAEAEERYRKCFSLREALAKETETDADRNNLAVNCEKIGDIAKENGRLDEAEEWYRKNRTLMETLAKATGSVLHRRNLSCSYLKLGEVARKKGALDEAEEWFRKSLALREELFEETGTKNAYSDLLYIRGLVDSVAKEKSKKNSAKEARKQVDVAGILRKSIGEYVECGDRARKEGNPSAAKNSYAAALERAKGLAEKTKLTVDLRNLAICYSRAGDLAKENGELAVAENHYRDVIMIRRQVFEKTGENQHRDDLAAAYFALGSLLSDAELLKLARDHWIDLYMGDKKNPRYQECLQKTTLEISKAKGGLMARMLGKRNAKKEKKKR